MNRAPGAPRIEASSPARLYATAVGAVLTLAGIGGFFYSASFGSPGDVEKLLGAFAANGWLNVLRLATGLAGLAAAGYAARAYALAVGLLYLVVAVWGFAVGGGDSILGIFPVNAEDNVLHLVLGLAGLAAGTATRGRAGAPLSPAGPA